MLAFHLGLLGTDFEVVEPSELRRHLRVLARRYARAAKAGRPKLPRRGNF
jgi:hypothetical protein